MENRNTAIFDACQCPASSSDEARAVFVDHHQRVGGRLGIYTRTASTPVNTRVREGQESGSLGDTTVDLAALRRAARAERWRLKWAADRLRDGRQRACHRVRQSKDKAVTVEVGTLPGDVKRAYYGGWVACGSVWGCPLCASKIANGRRVEVQAAMDAARRQGLRVLLLTLTVRHGLGDDVRDVLARMRAAWRRYTGDRQAKALRAAAGLVGTIRALEVTYGANGWHPHYHVLLFVRGNQTPEEMQRAWASVWCRICVSCGLPEPVQSVACTIQDGSHAANYVSKWGLAEELALSHLKHGKGGQTPWDLLRVYADRGEGAEQAGRLWREYAAAFKGQRQLYWSNGLRALLGVGAGQTDQELVDVVDPGAEVLASLSDIERQALVSMHALCEILEIAETDPDNVQLAIDSMVKLYLRNTGRDQRRAAAQRVMRGMAELAG